MRMVFPVPRCVVASAWLLAAGCAAEDVDGAHLRSGGFSQGDVVVGPLQILIADDLQGGQSWLVHRVVVDGQPVQLEFSGEPPTLPPGALVRVWGEDGYDTMEVDSIEVLSPPPQPVIGGDPYAPRRLAVILLDWGSGPELGVDEANSKMWSADTSSLKYWAEISYGKETFDGQVFGPYTMSYPGCNTDTIAFQAQQMILGDGANPADFEQYMYVFPEAGCGWSGLAMLGFPDQPEQDSWYNGSFGCVVRNQEVAHNYGLMHTHFYDCGNVPFSGNCNYEEYGSPYDPMGYGCGHMAAPDKTYMGWLQQCNVVDANISATFNLLPTETPCNGTQALRLPTFDGRKYWLEYRKPVGFDADEGTDGVLVHVSSPGDTWGPEAYGIDLGPGGFIHAGESYSDPNGAVTFIVQEEHDTHAVIDVVFPDGGSGTPQCLDGSTPMMVGGAYGTLDCAGGPFEPDGDPPVVSVTSPHDGSTFASGETFDVSIDAQDDSGVYSVSLLLDGTVADTKTEGPWEWEINDLPLGTHTLQATASDGALQGESAVINVEVSEHGGGGAGDGGGVGGGGDGGGDGSGAGGADGGSGSDGGSDGGDGGGLDPSVPGSLPPGFGQDGLGSGCSCRSRGEPPDALAWLFVVIGGAVRRRARSSARDRNVRPVVRDAGGATIARGCRRRPSPR